MVTEFSKLNHTLITPLLKSKGYRKIGPYDYGSTFDTAVYKLDNVEINVIFSIHPYDYPDHGIQLRIYTDEKLSYQKFYPVQEGGIKAMLELLAHDLKNGKIIGV